ncbi:hypothetical protein VCHA42P256_30248 [Vibrio chagasii]|nr:hypothetical protein VCHA42P256_30248 [Vibrio chagasii]
MSLCWFFYEGMVELSVIAPLTPKYDLRTKLEVYAEYKKNERSCSMFEESGQGFLDRYC